MPTSSCNAGVRSPSIRRAMPSRARAWSITRRSARARSSAPSGSRRPSAYSHDAVGVRDGARGTAPGTEQSRRTRRSCSTTCAVSPRQSISTRNCPAAGGGNGSAGRGAMLGGAPARAWATSRCEAASSASCRRRPSSTAAAVSGAGGPESGAAVPAAARRGPPGQPTSPWRIAPRRRHGACRAAAFGGKLAHSCSPGCSCRCAGRCGARCSSWRSTASSRSRRSGPAARRPGAASASGRCCS